MFQSFLRLEARCQEAIALIHTEVKEKREHNDPKRAKQTILINL